jgi:hypothetical protein
MDYGIGLAERTIFFRTTMTLTNVIYKVDVKIIDARLIILVEWRTIFYASLSYESESKRRVKCTHS